MEVACETQRTLTVPPKPADIGQKSADWLLFKQNHTICQKYEKHITDFAIWVSKKEETTENLHLALFEYLNGLVESNAISTSKYREMLLVFQAFWRVTKRGRLNLETGNDLHMKEVDDHPRKIKKPRCPLSYYFSKDDISK